MSHEIASAIIKESLGKFRRFSYAEMVDLVGQVRADSVVGPDGNAYQVESEARWDNKVGGSIRVMIAVDGSGISAFKPVVGNFIMLPDGSIVE
jgi:hypothetical protein